MCKNIVTLHEKAIGVTVPLSFNTVYRLATGKQSIQDFNKSKAWLTKEESDIVIEFAIKTAAPGFPLSHRQLAEHVDEILHARLGPTFHGVGKNWTDYFVEKHSAYLNTYYSHPLDSSWGQAVNPHTNKAYFNILDGIFRTGDNREAITEECSVMLRSVAFGQGHRLFMCLALPVGNDHGLSDLSQYGSPLPASQ